MTHTRRIQWECSCLVRKNKIRTSTAIIDMSNGKIYMFSLSVDGMLGKEALVALTNLSLLVEVKMEKPIMHVQGSVNSQIVIAVSKYYHRMIHIACPPSLLWYRDTYWESGSGLGLTQKLARQNSFAHTCTKLFCFLTDIEFTFLYQ